ncbi:hypothetical protein RMCBS344292_15322 [Rhizopus microsporus]|nr:hypothetical protein RMCBS344292_15322 [Rhizopus microsporus]
MKQHEPITHFIAQFPDGDVTEESVALYSEEEGEYVGVNLDIRWCLEKTYSKERKKGKHTRVIRKKHLGSVYCNIPECTFYEIDRRPYALKKDVEKQQCLICDSKLERRLCTVTVNFKFGDGRCKMVHNGKHSHSTYLPKHLTVAEKCRLDEKVDEDPHIKPSKAVVGVSSRTEEAVPAVYNSVSKILINKDRAKNELDNAK